MWKVQSGKPNLEQLEKLKHGTVGQVQDLENDRENTCLCSTPWHGVEQRHGLNKGKLLIEQLDQVHQNVLHLSCNTHKIYIVDIVSVARKLSDFEKCVEQNQHVDLFHVFLKTLKRSTCWFRARHMLIFVLNQILIHVLILFAFILIQYERKQNQHVN